MAEQLTAAQLMVKALENEGVDRIFGIPGEENVALLDAIRTSSIELILTRHEQAAAFMAATHGRLTGTPGVCLTTLGPGALNLTTAAAYALLGGMPMVMLTAQKGVLTAEQARFQMVDTVSVMTPMTKFSRQIVSPQMVPTMVRKAFRVAADERPGPVHLELPEDIAVGTTYQTELVEPNAPMRPTATPEAVEEIAEIISKAERPLVMLGAGAARANCQESLARFIDTLDLPFFSTQMGKGAVSDFNEHYLGTAALTADDYVHDAITAADVIISIGHDTVEKPPFIMKPGGPTVIHVDYAPAFIEKVYSPQHGLIGDIPHSIDSLRERLEGKVPNASALLELRDGIHEHIADKATEDRLIPQRIVNDVREVMPEDGIVALDNGMYKVWFARNYPAYAPSTLLLDNALASMGAGLPSAMMAKILNPDRRVLAVCGDGGFMMNSQEMATAVSLGLDLVVIVIDDAAYGMIRWKQSKEGYTDFGMTFNNPDFVAYAEAYGATGSRVNSAEELKPTLERAFEEGGVQLVAVPIDYSENTTVFVDELNARKN